MAYADDQKRKCWRKRVKGGYFVPDLRRRELRGGRWRCIRRDGEVFAGGPGRPPRIPDRAVAVMRLLYEDHAVGPWVMARRLSMLPQVVEKIVYYLRRTVVSPAAMARSVPTVEDGFAELERLLGNKKARP